MKTLLSKGTSNAKTIKNPLRTFILYLAPYRTAVSAYNVCQYATKGCIDACLFTAGMAGVYPSIQLARIAKTKLFIENMTGFLYQLASELTKINNQGIKTAIRLNGTSDIDFIKLLFIKCKLDVFTLKNLKFYDYTKVPNRLKDYANKPYTITFSRSENNWSNCIDMLTAGINVSVLFDHKKPLPKVYKGYRVVDGDKNDVVMMKHKGVILGLKAKGKARKDETGFVVRDLNN